MSRASDATWTGWRPLADSPPLNPAVLAEILDGGQAFRWHPTSSNDPCWVGIFGPHAARIRLDTTGRPHWSVLARPNGTSESEFSRYLNLGSNLARSVDSLPWRSDAHLKRCIDAFPGLTILRQPFGETLLCFLCSATKQIVQIKQMVGLLANRHGAALAKELEATAGVVGTALFRLPTWAELAAVPETDLRACLLGFRARYIHQTAQFLASRPGWLDETEQLPYAEAKARLCSLPGVGEKVADCVLLFGAGRMEAFPVDVWIIKAMALRYGLEGWKPSQIAHFGRTHFGPFAGLAQQYLFAWERRFGRSSKPAGL